MKTYVAYGSNLNKTWMSNLCPSAKFISTGTIPNAALYFRGKGYLNLVRMPTEQPLPVALWSIEDKDEDALDVYEEYPDYYKKETVTVSTKHGDVQAMIYLMCPKYENVKARPTEKYTQRVRQGFSDMNFDQSIVDKALSEVGCLTLNKH